MAKTGDVRWFGAVGDGFAIEGTVAVGVAVTMAMTVATVTPVRRGDGGGGGGTSAAEPRVALHF